ncbi:MAG: ATP-binding protein [Alphaproteobacteria bacterium]|nr:ATP-binding protein [Alphaproteobacteria bacterium]
MIERRGWGITALFGFLIAGALAIVLGAGALFATHEREKAAQQAFARAVVERAGSMASALSDLEVEQRDDALEDYHTRNFRVWISETRPEAPIEAWRHSDPVIEAGTAALPVEHLDDFILHALNGHPGAFDANRSPGEIGRDDWQPGFYALMVGLPLDDGGWIVAVAPARPATARPGSFALMMMGLAVVVVVILSLVVVKRLTRPLRTLAGAAERLSVDLDAPPLKEGGTREVREAVTAFNAMQDHLRRLIDDRSLMLAALSHDLRTIITRLRLRTEEIDDETQRNKAFDDLADMEIMLKETLDAARGEASHEERQKVDVAALVASLIDDLADAGETASYEGPDRLTLACRPVALRRALGNLIQNAIRYGDSAEVNLAKSASGVTIDVADRGPGIPADQREAMFRPFMRGEPSRNRATGGTGLGLSVTRSILRAHGGDVELLDRDGGGLIARVSLPHEVET